MTKKKTRRIPMWDDNWGKLQFALILMHAGRTEEAEIMLRQICDAADRAPPWSDDD